MVKGKLTLPSNKKVAIQYYFAKVLPVNVIMKIVWLKETYN